MHINVQNVPTRGYAPFSSVGKQQRNHEANNALAAAVAALSISLLIATPASLWLIACCFSFLAGR